MRALAREQGRDIGHDAIVAAAAALERPLAVVHLADAVEADGHREAMPLEEVAVVLGERGCRWS